MTVAAVLWCRTCGNWYAAQAACPHCLLAAAAGEPVKPYRLSENDRHFLKSIRIAANNDHEDDAA